MINSLLFFHTRRFLWPGWQGLYKRVCSTPGSPKKHADRCIDCRSLTTSMVTSQAILMLQARHTPKFPTTVQSMHHQRLVQTQHRRYGKRWRIWTRKWWLNCSSSHQLGLLLGAKHEVHMIYWPQPNADQELAGSSFSEAKGTQPRNASLEMQDLLFQ
jgi:hypothetical protein